MKNSSCSSIFANKRRSPLVSLSLGTLFIFEAAFPLSWNKYEKMKIVKDTTPYIALGHNSLNPKRKIQIVT